MRTIETPLPVSEVQERFARIVQPRLRLMKRLENMMDWEPHTRPFEGTIDNGSFKVRRIIKYRNDLLPTIRGRWSRNEHGGTTVHLQMMLGWSAILFEIVFSAILVPAYVKYRQNFVGFCILVNIVFMLIGFVPEVIIAERALRRTLT